LKIEILCVPWRGQAGSLFPHTAARRHRRCTCVEAYIVVSWPFGSRHKIVSRLLLLDVRGNDLCGRPKPDMLWWTAPPHIVGVFPKMADRLHTTANANPLVPLTPLQEFATEISTTVSGVAASARKIGRPRKPRVTRPRKYRKLDNLTRARIIGMRQAGLSFRKISKKTGVHYSTCYDAWRRFKATGRVEHRHTQPRRGTTKYTAAMKEFIVASFLLMISTSSRIVKEVFGYKYPHTSISISTVRRIRMEGRITLKSIRTRPVRWNTRPTIKKRQEYAAWRHNNIAATKCRYLFYDEQNYNIAMTSSVGYACRGVNAVLKKPTRTKGGATSLHLCVSPDYGYVAMHVVAKDTDAVTAASFIGTLAKRLKFFDRCEARYPGGGKSRLPWLLILDNEKQHHTANVRRQLEGHGIPYKFLPPYSPFLNPIQHCFSLVSGHLTSGFTFRELNGARSGSASNRQFKRLAKRIIAAAQATVTALKVREFLQFSDGFLHACRVGVPICDGSHPPTCPEAG